MGTVQATVKGNPAPKGSAASKRAGARKQPAGGRAGDAPSAAELRDLLDQALSDLDADPRTGSLLRATGLRIRFRITDLGLVLNVAPSEEGAHHLRWTFSNRTRWEPKLELVMDSETANAYLQGKESLAIAIAQGRVRCKGETRWALLYVPSLRVLVDPYRRLVRRRYPELALG